MSGGVRGATATVGSRGVYGSVGVPGTGLSARQKLGGSGESPISRGQGAMVVTLSLKDNGTVDLFDGESNPLTPRLVKRVREQNGDQIQAWLQERCDEWNQGIDEILNIHSSTPDPSKPITFSPEPFDTPEPIEPAPKPFDFLAKIFKSRRRLRGIIPPMLSGMKSDEPTPRHRKYEESSSRKVDYHTPRECKILWKSSSPALTGLVKRLSLLRLTTRASA